MYMLTIQNLRAYGANVDDGVQRCLNDEGFYRHKHLSRYSLQTICRERHIIISKLEGDKRG